MQTLYDVAGIVSRRLMTLADKLREKGDAESASECDELSQRLSRAVHDSLTETQPIDVGEE